MVKISLAVVDGHSLSTHSGNIAFEQVTEVSCSREVENGSHFSSHMLVEQACGFLSCVFIFSL